MKKRQQYTWTHENVVIHRNQGCADFIIYVDGKWSYCYRTLVWAKKWVAKKLKKDGKYPLTTSRN